MEAVRDLDAALALHIDAATAMLPPETVAMFRATVASVRTLANVGEIGLSSGQVH